MSEVIFILILILPPFAMLLWALYIKRRSNEGKNLYLVFASIIVALLLPILLGGFLYESFQSFLPEGSIVLTPKLRITASIINFIVTDLVTILLLKRAGYWKELFFLVIAGTLVFLWVAFFAISWYITL